MFRSFLHSVLFVSLTTVGSIGWGQAPDFELDRFYLIDNEGVDPRPVSANVKLFCDGEHLLLYIHVRDEDIALKGDPRGCDHVQVWFALPQKAYPDDFEYQLHPSYVRAPATTLRSGKEEPPRFFSMIGEYNRGGELDLNAFVTDFDYPDHQDTRVPLSHVLDTDEVHFGLVHFALFPDGRFPLHLNREQARPVEQSLGESLGNITSGIDYQATYEPGRGYEIHAQISREALGFTTLPAMDELRLMVDIWDVPSPRKPAVPILTTAPYRQPNKPYTFNSVYLRRPLYTNFTTIPDALFNGTSYHPICFYSDRGWVATGVDVDALVYREMEASQWLTEVRFTPQPFYYNIQNYRGLDVDRLTVDSEYVNELPRSRTLFWVGDQPLSSERVKGVSQPESALEDEVVDFKDGTLGVIIRDNATADPYGWGAWGTSLEERISIYRVAWGSRERLLTIEQGDGPNPYCNIGDYSYEGYFVQAIDWIEQERFFVVRLSHRMRDDKKRVKLLWDEAFSQVQISPLR